VTRNKWYSTGLQNIAGHNDYYLSFGHKPLAIYFMPLDLFKTISSISENDLHPKYKILRDDIMMDGERVVLLSWADGFVDRDNKIINEFQTTFHSSFWEFYLFRALMDAGFIIDFSHDRPDFIITSPMEMYIEAVVSNIKIDGEKEEKRNIDNILSMIVPVQHQEDFKTLIDEAIVRNSNAINTKSKKYLEKYITCDWVKPEVPFVIALSSYDQIDYGREYYYPMMALLYGLYYNPATGNFDSIKEVTKPGTTSSIPVGIFNDPTMAHISGIFFTCTVTLGKLTSLANSVLSSEQRLNEVLNIRHDQDAPHYKMHKVSVAVPEELTDGLFFFHNSLAKNRIPKEIFQRTNCLQVTFDDGELYMEGENSPIVARINLPKFILTDVAISLIGIDFNRGI
jgi:hypothetical protein